MGNDMKLDDIKKLEKMQIAAFLELKVLNSHSRVRWLDYTGAIQDAGPELIRLARLHLEYLQHQEDEADRYAEHMMRNPK